MGRWGGRSLKPITLPRPKHRPAQDDDDAIYGMVAVAGLQENGFGKFGPILAFLAKYLHFWPNIGIFSSFDALLVGSCGAHCISQDTYLLYY